jgi:hypothetical protein
MNQLSNIVIDIARDRRAMNDARPRTATALGSRRARSALLIRRWRRDAATGRLISSRAAQHGAREAQPPLRLSPAS